MAVDTSTLIGEVSLQNSLLFIFVVILTIIIGNMANMLNFFELADITRQKSAL